MRSKKEFAAWLRSKADEHTIKASQLLGERDEIYNPNCVLGCTWSDLTPGARDMFNALSMLSKIENEVACALLDLAREVEGKE